MLGKERDEVVGENRDKKGGRERPTKEMTSGGRASRSMKKEKTRGEIRKRDRTR